MRGPTDPVLRLIARVGAGLVELSYTVRDPARALGEAARLYGELRASMAGSPGVSGPDGARR
jgi:hypothetical protein